MITSAQDKTSLEAQDTALLQERLAWAVAPLATLFVTLFWVLNPAVADQAMVRQETLIGFLLGAGIGLLKYNKIIWSHLSFHLEGGAYRKNRVPEEFYWGAKDEILFSKKEG